MPKCAHLLDAAKLTYVFGPKIELLTIDQGFGTYTIVTDPDPGQTEITFTVTLGTPSSP